MQIHDRAEVIIKVRSITTLTVTVALAIFRYCCV